MGVLFDYFAAADDAAAAATIDRPGGPGQPATAALVRGRGLFGQTRRRTHTPGEVAMLPTVGDTGIDPVVKGGTLEALLTKRPYEQIKDDPRWGKPLAMRDGGERLVLTLTDGLVAALANAGLEELAAVAASWSATEEFMGTGNPSELTVVLVDLSELCRDARARGEGVYCWVSL